MRPSLLAGGFELSPIQQGMLYHHLLDPRGGTDIEQMVAALDESIDPAAFGQAWQRVVDHRSALRLSFHWEGLDRPRQVENDEVRIALDSRDWSRLDPERQDQETAEYLEWDRAEGFDLRRPPLMRLTLCRLGDRRYRLFWSFHHILIDGRSFETILRDVFGVYESIVSGSSAPLSEDRSTRDYVKWIGSLDPTTSAAFWRARLAGFRAPVELPYDRALDGASGTGRFGQRELALSARTTTRLRTFAQAEGLTLNTLIMAVWALLLGRYSGEQDVVFGVTKTTRHNPVPGADSMTGLFLATIPVRVRIAPAASVREWLKQVRSEWVGLRGHEYLPLAQIKEASEVPASAQLFESLVVFENYLFASRLRELGEKWLNRRFHLREQTGFPLAFLGYGDTELLLKIEYDSRRFDEAKIDRMLRQLHVMLSAIPGHADAPLCELSMMTAEERRQVLEDWNRTELEYPRETPLAELVEATVERTPSAVAVVFGNDRLTYAELNRQANQLARELRKHVGEGTGALVGISIDRSPGMMVALLGVIKAGCGYVPLDPYFPPERLAHMIEDSGLQVLVTEKRVRPSLPPFRGTIVEVDGADWRRNSDANLGLQVSPEHPAYVLYTSGSTGKPKGVLIPRGALLNLLWSMREWLRLGPSDRLLAVTTISFDIAGVDIWLPWLVGAQTVLASRAETADGASLRALVENQRITFLQATPVTWHLLLEAGWAGSPDIQIVCTGEAMPRDLARKLRPLAGRLWNLYGPTETTIWSTGFRVDRGDEPVLIGRPVANTQCYILDPYMQPVPAGMTGELYIAGDGLAREYLNRPELTEEKFLPNPFCAGTRMYRTGDLARYHPNGNIECLGRTDHQVKIRGFRIELGEIETGLAEFPGVRQAVVVARADTPGDKRLAAYIVPSDDHAPPARKDLRDWLKRRLPDYMVPADYVLLKEIPISANGKIDRKSLPAPAAAGTADSPKSYLAPRTSIEQQLQAIWSEVFERERIGVHDDFFELGGHSLLAVRLMVRISKAFRRDLPLNILFQAPTIERLAARLETGPSGPVARHHLVPIRPDGSRPPLYWIPGGAAIGMFSKDVARSLSPDQPVYGLGSARPATLEELEDVPGRAAAYLELVRSFQPEGPYCFVGFCLGGRIAFEMAQQLLRAGARVGFVGMVNSWYPDFPPPGLPRLRFRTQRLLHQVRTARRETSLLDYARQKLADRRAAGQEREEMRAVEQSFRQRGVVDGGEVGDEVLAKVALEKMQAYAPKFYLGKLWMFLSDDPDIQGVSADLDPRLVWRNVAAAHEIRRFPGDHEGILKMPHAAVFARHLDECLWEALRDGTPLVPPTRL